MKDEFEKSTVIKKLKGRADIRKKSVLEVRNTANGGKLKIAVIESEVESHEAADALREAVAKVMREKGYEPEGRMSEAPGVIGYAPKNEVSKEELSALFPAIREEAVTLFNQKMKEAEEDELAISSSATVEIG